MPRFATMISQIVDCLHHTRVRDFLPHREPCTAALDTRTNPCAQPPLEDQQPNAYQRVYRSTPTSWGQDGGFSPPACEAQSETRCRSSASRRQTPPCTARSFRLFEASDQRVEARASLTSTRPTGDRSPHTSTGSPRRAST